MGLGLGDFGVQNKRIEPVYAIFIALPCKRNGQAALNSTMAVKHIVLHAVYLHFKDKQRKRTVCATN